MKSVVDLFCGAGGASEGVAQACEALGMERPALVAVNHWSVAVETHRRNHPWAKHYCQRVEGLDPRQADGTPTGHIVRERGRAIGEVYAELRRRLEAEKLLDEGLSLMVRYGDGVPGELTEESEWPRDHRHVACFAVTGANEGWYSYVELLWNSRGHGDVPRRKLLFLTKTFDGMDRAYQVAKRCAELLGA